MGASRKPLRIQRRVRKIGFLGRGMAFSLGEESDLVHRIETKVGEESISADPILLERVRLDAETVPRFLGKLFSAKPKAVVYPKSSDDVASVLEVCTDEQSPIVIRGAATAGLGGAYSPGGIVLDLSHMDAIEGIEKSSNEVVVKSGCKWRKLCEILNSEGYEVLSFPLSGDLSTIGGWLSTGGLGWGSLANGEFAKQVISIEVATPSGLLIEAGRHGMRYSIRSFTGTEGQMGVITSLRIKIKPKVGDSYPVLALSGRVSSLIAIARDLLDAGLVPSSMTLFSQNLWRMVSTAEDQDDTLIIGVGDQGVSNLESSLTRLIKQTDTSVNLCKIDLDVRRIMVGNLLLERGAEMLGEAILPGRSVDGLIRSLIEKPSERREIIYFIQVLSGDRFLVFLFATTDFSQKGVLKRNPRKTLKLANYAISNRGLPYGVGVWNTPFCKRILGQDYKALKQVKQETDRLSLVNPGRFFELKSGQGIPVPGFLLNTALKFG